VGTQRGTKRSSNSEWIVGINENKHKREINRDYWDGSAYHTLGPTILLLVQFYSQNLKAHSSLN
jgi:hypothetical protein